LEGRPTMCPSKSRLSEYQTNVKAVLDRIAAWKPTPGHHVSTTAMTIAATHESGDFKTNRDVIHAVFELLQDRHFVVRTNGCWRFTRAFRQEHADELIAWDGLWTPTRDCNTTNHR